MTRVEMVKRLMNEGLSQKTLVNFTDIQLRSLCDRMLNEATVKQVKVYSMSNPSDAAEINTIINDPKKVTDISKQGHIQVTKEEKNKPTQKQLSVLDKNKNKKIDKQDFELLRKGKKQDTNESLMGIGYAVIADKLKEKLGKNPTHDEINRELEKLRKELEKSYKKDTNKKSEVKEGDDESKSKGWKQKYEDLLKKYEDEKNDPKKYSPEELKRKNEPKKDNKDTDLSRTFNKVYDNWGKDKKSEVKEGGKFDKKTKLAMTLKKLKENHEISEWVNNLAETNYHPFTSKGEIMELLQRKLNETETMIPMPKKAKKGHNGIPEFMTYDSIMGSTKEKETETPVITPTTPTKPKINPYDPGPGTDTKPKALAEKKKK